MPLVDFDTFTVEAPDGWSDFTEEVEAEDPLYTLAHEDGVGALQFSLALYTAGRVPDPSPAELLDMVKEFGQKKRLGKATALVSESGPPVLAAGSFAWDEDFLRVWQVSDGRNFAFITYTCERQDAGQELATCEQIVRSIEFGRA
ncbi:hypothetical protein [Blastopirellula marina]|nr:hypothetical protein [Blastopirellula marina]